MNVLTIIALVFAVIGAVDYICGSKLGLGKDFEKGFALLGTMALSMIGMIVICPLIANWLSPLFDGVYKVLHIDPSIIPALLFANDMGGAHLAVAVAQNDAIGTFNALVVSSMMGCTLSFTIPFAMQLVDKKRHRELALGLLCGIVTIPIGCFVAGLICRLPVVDLLVNLLPLLILAILIAVGLLFAPKVCVAIFKGLGYVIKIVVFVGLFLGAINLLYGSEVIKGLGSIEEGAMICLRISIFLAGMFPLISIITRLLNKSLQFLGGKLAMNEMSVTRLLATIASSAPTFGSMNEMDDKGVMLNSAFAVSGAFLLGSHLVFTLAFDDAYVLPVIVGKLIAGLLAIIFAYFLYGKLHKKSEQLGEKSDVA